MGIERHKFANDINKTVPFQIKIAIKKGNLKVRPVYIADECSFSSFSSPVYRVGHPLICIPSGYIATGISQKIESSRRLG